MEKHDIYQKELPHRAVTVYVYLADRTNKQGECWPAISTIARDLKLSPSTVRRALRDLRKAGVIESEQRYRDNGGKSSLLYKLDAEGREKVPPSHTREYDTLLQVAGGTCHGDR